MKADFLKSIDEKDLIMTRILLSNELLIDPRGVSYSEMKEYALAHIDDLFEVDKPYKFSENPDDWDDDFLNRLKYRLDSNFSKEKLELYEKVIPVVLKEKIDYLNNNPTEEDEPNTDSHKVDSPLLDDKWLKVGAISGFAIGTLGFCFVKPLLTITGVGITLVSVGGLLYNKIKQK